MKSDFVKKMINNIPEYVKMFSNLYVEFIVRINESLKSQNISKKQKIKMVENKGLVRVWI